MPILGMALHHHRMLEDERRPWPQSHCRFGRCPSWPPLVAASGCSRKLRRGRCLHGDGKLGVPIISVALCNGRQPKNPMIGVQHRRPIPGDPIYVNRCARRRGPCVGSSTCSSAKRTPLLRVPSHCGHDPGPAWTMYVCVYVCVYVQHMRMCMCVYPYSLTPLRSYAPTPVMETIAWLVSLSRD